MTMFEVRPAEQAFPYVTIRGKVIPETAEDRMLLCLTMRRFTFETRKATSLMWKHKMNQTRTIKTLQADGLDYIYAESAVKHAKLVVEGAEATGGTPWRHFSATTLMVFARGSKWESYGNRNIKLLDYDESLQCFKMRIKAISTVRSTINCRVYFGEKYIPLVKELLQLAKNREEGVPIRISFDPEKRSFYCYISVPLQLYLKYFKKYDKPLLDVDRYCAGADLGSGFVKWVIVDMETWRPVKWLVSEFPQVTQHGYPRERAWNEIVDTVDKTLQWLYNYGVSVVFLEDLEKVKRKKRPRCKTPRARRKATIFRKRRLFTWLALRCLKYGFKVYLVDPRDSSLAARYFASYLYNVDKDYGAAYIIALRGLLALTRH